MKLSRIEQVTSRLVTTYYLLAGHYNKWSAFSIINAPSLILVATLNLIEFLELKSNYKTHIACSCLNLEITRSIKSYPFEKQTLKMFVKEQHSWPSLQLLEKTTNRIGQIYRSTTRIVVKKTQKSRKCKKSLRGNLVLVTHWCLR